MALSLPRKMVLANAAASGVLALFAFAAYRSFTRAFDSGRWVRHSESALTTAHEVLIDVTSAETAERGYLLTGSTQLLEGYGRALGQTNAELFRLRTLVSDNWQQSSRVSMLQRAITAQLAEYQRTIDLTRLGDRTSALEAVRSAREQQRMTQVRRRLEQIVATERTLLEQRRATEDANVRVVVGVIGAGFLVALFVVVGATITLFHDVREREAVGAELADALARSKAADRAKSDFMARMSHELRTPLNSIIGFANILMRTARPRLTPQDVTYLERVQVNGRHLLALINDILDLAKVESGRVDVHLQPVSLPALIAETITQIPAREDLVVDTVLPPTLEPVVTDPDRLRQVLLNLLSNAIKFTEQGSVRVRVRATEAGLPRRIEVSDTGIGIAPGRQQAIFEAFEQAEVSTARRYGGTGLGLSISRSICEQLGYRLAVASEPGVGSTFTILLDPNEALPTRHEPLRRIATLAIRESVAAN